MSTNPLSRRDMLSGRRLGGLLGGLLGDLQRAVEPAAPAPPPPEPPAHALLRPPGAAPDFLARCTQCDACIKACPHQAIFHAGPALGPSAGTPILDPARNPCLWCSDKPCIGACPTGALHPTRADHAVGRARILLSSCLAHQGTTCTVCAERCPIPEAITLEHGKPRVHADRCVGCGVCAWVCPAPGGAVAIQPVPPVLARAADPVPKPAP